MRENVTVLGLRDELQRGEPRTFEELPQIRPFLTSSMGPKRGTRASLPGPRPEAPAPSDPPA